jgi:nucleoside-diphosphate kinase
MALESTLVIIKPDGIQKSLTGNVLSKLSDAKLVILAAKMKVVSRPLAEEHYHHLKDKPFFDELVRFMMGEFHTKRVMALVYHGEDAIKKVRAICGATNPEQADPASIRGAYGRITTQGVFENVIHASGTEEEAAREIQLWFEPSDIVVDNLFPVKEVSVSDKKMVWASAVKAKA